MSDIYTLINYFDVWGNEEDGWEVNNAYEEFDIRITDNMTDQDIISFLYEKEFFNTKDIDKFLIESNGDSIEIFETETGKPLCSLIKKEVFE